MTTVRDFLFLDWGLPLKWKETKKNSRGVHGWSRIKKTNTRIFPGMALLPLSIVLVLAAQPGPAALALTRSGSGLKRTTTLVSLAMIPGSPEICPY
jgi:hypothetical protein